MHSIEIFSFISLLFGSILTSPLKKSNFDQNASHVQDMASTPLVPSSLAIPNLNQQARHEVAGENVIGSTTKEALVDVPQPTCDWWATDCYDVNTSMRPAKSRTEMVQECVGKTDDECKMIQEMVAMEEKAKKMTSSIFCEEYPMFCRRRSGCPWWVNDSECDKLSRGISDHRCDNGGPGHMHSDCVAGVSYTDIILKAGCPWWGWEDCYT